MDLMKRLRARTANTVAQPRSQQSTSQQHNSGRCPGPSVPQPAPPHLHPPVTTPHESLVSSLPPPPTNHICPWKFSTTPTKSHVSSRTVTRKQLKTCKNSYAGVCSEKVVCQEYPPMWDRWLKDNILTNSVIVTSDNVEFPIHHTMMAAASPHFRSLFQSRRPEQGNRDVLNVDSKLMKTIVDYVYHGNCEVTLENVEPLLEAAHRFQLLGIIQLCSKFLVKSMTPENALKLYKQGKPYACQEIQRQGKLYLLHNFKEILQKDEFLKLEFEELEDLLRDDLLNIRNEETAFHAIKTWIEHAPHERSPRIVELLQCVRFGLMNLQFFSGVVLNWKYIAANRDVLDSLFEAQLFLATMDSRNGADVDLNDPIARPRVPYEIIFAIGGWSAGSPTSFMETYDVRADRWFLSHGSDVTPRAYHGLVTLGHKIYMIGGFDGNEHFNTMRCFDPTSRTWTEKANMHFPRCYISCCVLNGQIYAMGGFNGRSRMNSVERYDPVTNQWTILAPMTRQRSDASACTVKDKVYVAGGFNGQEVLNSVEVYDPIENQWSFIHPMRSPRSGVVVTAYKDKLYAIGGFNGFTRLSTAEVYNPKYPADWQLIAEMSSPRSNFAAAVIDDMIFVIGGFNGTTTIPYVECYDSTQNEWFDAAHMNLNRSALAACVLRGLPNARDYSYLSRVQELLGLDMQPQPIGGRNDPDLAPPLNPAPTNH